MPRTVLLREASLQMVVTWQKKQESSCTPNRSEWHARHDRTPKIASSKAAMSARLQSVCAHLAVIMACRVVLGHHLAHRRSNIRDCNNAWADQCRAPARHAIHTHTHTSLAEAAPCQALGCSKLLSPLRRNILRHTEQRWAEQATLSQADDRPDRYNAPTAVPTS